MHSSEIKLLVQCNLTLLLLNVPDKIEEKNKDNTYIKPLQSAMKFKTIYRHTTLKLTSETRITLNAQGLLYLQMKLNHS